MGKLKYEDVKKSIEDKKWKLISTKYVNLNTDLTLQCPEGHEVKMTFKDWRSCENPECPICCFQPFKKINENNVRKKGKRVLGFDQSTYISGWALFEENCLINYGHFNAKKGNAEERISEVKAWVLSMVDKYNPDKLAIEDIQLQTIEGEEAVLTYKLLAQLQGVLINTFYEKGFSYQVVPPSTWKKNANIKGTTRTDQKRNAQLKVKQLYDCKVTQDEADAILLSRYASKKSKTIETIYFE